MSRVMTAACTLALALGIVAGVARAAERIGTVVSSEKSRVRLVLTGAAEPWIKKGAPVRILGGRGAILEVKGDTLTISTPKARTLGPGDAVTFEKPRSTSGGC
ncbi:MAG: hypothetical protein IT348_09780 [Candidatus Eisenbacteria bacterium]|nr:hypothetical protein [Candidatus Eisenbacteria bacterium]